MFKKKNNSWYKRNVSAQSTHLNELVDWTNDGTYETAYRLMNPTVVDIDELERQRAQNLPLEQGEVSTITEEEVSDYMVDDFLQQDQQLEEVEDTERVEEGYFDGSYVPSEDELKELGIEPVEDTGEVVDESPDDVPDFGEDHESALRWAIENNRVVKLSYLTLGKKRGRGGKQYLKREMTDDSAPGTGVNIWRIVEPHHIFSAKNGYDILVTYDRSVRHIRAFRVSNITDVEFVKKRVSNEPSYFRPRVKIQSPEGLEQSGKIKGIEAMNNNIFQNLKSIGDNLESQGLSKTASVITKTMSSLLNIKIAQYVGPQGYWIRQKRCWDNCYRQKRTTAPEKAAQVVWTECWEEYNEAINNNQSGWEKYAQEDTNLFKYASQEQADWVQKENKKFAKSVELKMAEGKSPGISIYLSLEQKQAEYSDTLISDADSLSKIAETLKENGQEELSEKLANVSVELLKEAQFGGGFENWMNKARKINPFSGKSREKGLTGDIVNRLKSISQKAKQFSQQFNSMKSDAIQSGNQFQTDQNALDQKGMAQDARNQKMKDMAGKAINTVKQMPGQAFQAGQNAVNNFVNPGPGQMLSNRGASAPVYNLKIARQPGTYQEEGVVNFVNNLKQQLQSYLNDLSNEAANMATMSTQSADPASQTRAKQAYTRINKLVADITSSISSMTTFRTAIAAADEVVASLNTFGNDIQKIIAGEYKPIATLTKEPLEDLNNNKVIDQGDAAIKEQPEQFAPTSTNVLTGDMMKDIEAMKTNKKLREYVASLIAQTTI